MTRIPRNHMIQGSLVDDDGCPRDQEWEASEREVRNDGVSRLPRLIVDPVEAMEPVIDLLENAKPKGQSDE